MQHTWEHNVWTGEDILRLSDNERIIRQKFNDGSFLYRAEFWGDFSLLYPIKGSMKETLKSAKEDLVGLKIKDLHKAR